MSGEETTNISNILGELHLGDVKGKKVPLDNDSNWFDHKPLNPFVCEFEVKKGLGKSPPLDVGSESSSPNDKEINCAPLKGVEGDIHNQHGKGTNSLITEDKSMPRLQKASSVPQIHSESLICKETNPEPDARLLGNVMQENQVLRENLVKLKTKNNEIIAINHDWDKSYNSLVQQHAELQKQFQKHNEQLNNEIVKKEEEKNRMKLKLERFFNEGSLDEKTLLAEEKEEKNKILKREQAAIQTAKEFQLKCQHLDHILRQTNQQKVNLEREMQRLSLCVESQQHKNFGASLGDSQNHMNLNGDVNEMELLRQQLQTYVEDFNAEKNEKQRLLQENEEMKIKLAAKIDENEHLKTQLEIYEKDFSRQREKRIQLMRKSNQMSRTGMPPAFGSNTRQDDAQRKMQEYNSLAVEKEHIVDRMSNLENQGVTAWSTTCYNSSSNGNNNSNGISNSLPPYPHSPQAYSQTNQSLPRSAPPYSFPTTDSNSDRFFNEKVMRDRGILSRSIPEKTDTYINNFNNLTSSTNSCWSYFGQ